MPSKSSGQALRHLRTLFSLGTVACLSDAQLLEQYIARRDELGEAAFATLVQRHGPMVLGACRRVLGDRHTAEDAFQAAFLVLAHKARSIARRERLASWLYGVALRCAQKARSRALRQRVREVPLMPSVEIAKPDDPAPDDDLIAILDEELARLPDRLRSAVVLCELEGLTRSTAALRLGIPEGTLSSRLASARRLLRERLTRRDAALSLPALIGALARDVRAAAVPAGLIESTVRAATQIAAGAHTSAAATASVAAITKGVLKAMLIANLKGVGLGMIVLVAVATGAVLAQTQEPGFVGPKAQTEGAAILEPAPNAGAQPAKSDAQQAGAERPALEPMMNVSGQVRNPQGRPFNGARLILVGRSQKPEDLGTSGADGRFTVKVPEGSLPGRFLAACAPGAGLDFAAIAGLNPARAVELRLVKDHVIQGKVLDTQGKPVAGVEVAVIVLGAFDGNSVDRFLSASTNRMFSFQWPGGDRNLWPAVGDIAAATTDADGRFRLAGTGAERLVHLRTSGAGSAAAHWQVVNHPGLDATPYNETVRKQSAIFVSGSQDDPAPVLHGPEPVFVVEPGKVIRGVVRDPGTGKPWPGVEVHCKANSATTDAAGSYEIRGVHKDKSYWLWINADVSAGLLGGEARVPDTEGYAPVTADIAATRVTQTAVITGRMIDAATGKGIRGDIHLAAPADNAFARTLPHRDYDHSTSTAEDGTFRIVTIPGPVLLMGGVDYEWSPAGQAYPSRKYKPATADPGYPQYFSADHPGAYASSTGAFAALQGSYCKVLQIEPGTTLKQDISVEPASTVTIKLQDSTGRPLVNTIVWEEGRRSGGFGDPTMRVETDSWLAQGVAESGQPRRMVFYEPGTKLFATLTLKGDEKGPVVVRLLPCGVVRGTVVDGAGKPVSGVNVNLTYNNAGLDKEGIVTHVHAYIHGADRVVTDAGGTFIIDEVIPGLEFRLWRRYASKRSGYGQGLVDKAKVESGRTTDLGKLKVAEGE